MASVLSAPYMHDEAAAFAELESIVWPDGPVCPHCGGMDRVYVLNGVKDKRGRVRLGLKKCGHCRKQFTVRVGTVFESSHVPLHQWFQAVYLLCSSKKGISSNQLARTLGVTVKTGWFMSHRIREAMRTGELAPMGFGGGAVESDETFIGNARPKAKKSRGYQHKHKVLALVDRQTGRATSMVGNLQAGTIVPILRANIAREARVMTDEAGWYHSLPQHFAEHHVLQHNREEWARGDAHTNTIEGYFSIFKRGMKGVYQHCAGKHLHRYLAEFDFRYSHRCGLGIDDLARTQTALSGIVGKRLTYRGSRAEPLTV